MEEYEVGEKTIATIGTFDGVHLGHRQILNTLIRDAKIHGGESLIISFHPHPRLVLFPEDNPLRLLQTIDEKITLLDKIGIDKLLLIPFTREFSRIQSSEFIRKILVDTVCIHKIIIGYDHHFGRNREGGLTDLRAGAALHGFEVQEIPAHQIDDAKISSTKIRKSLLRGDIITANKYLDYPYELSGNIIQGNQLGRKLGYPTANVSPPDPHKLIPGNGVYFVGIEVGGEKGFGMLNIGNKPTVGTYDRSIEVHIFDWNQSIYGRNLRIRLFRKLRDEVKFESLEALSAQIGKDEARCREMMEAFQSDL